MNPDKKLEMEQDLELLREKFDEINREIRLPHSLEADAMLKLLEKVEQEPKTEKNHKVLWLKPLAAIAACFVVVAGSVYALRGTGSKSSSVLSSELSVSKEAGDAIAPEYALRALEEPAGGMGGGDTGGGGPGQEANSGEVTAQAGEAADGQNADGEVYYADNYTQLRDAAFKMSGGIDRYTAQNIEEDAAADEAYSKDTRGKQAEPQSSKMELFASPSVAETSYSAANAPEDGADEADVVKTDGVYLYSLDENDSAGSYIYITDAAKMKVTAKIQVDDDVSEFYVSDNRLITVESASDAIPREKLPAVTIVGATDDSLVKQIQQTASPDQNQDDVREDESETDSVQVRIFDLSDRSDPKIVKTFAQDGRYISSRMESGALYIVSGFSIAPEFSIQNAQLSSLIPAVYDSASSRAQLLSADQIAILPNSDRASYTVISAMDTSSGKFVTQAVLGSSDGVYMSQNNLYLYRTDFQQANGSQGAEVTRMIRFSVNKSQVSLAADGTVTGSPYGQFAFNESSNGRLRIAVTATQPDGSMTNSLYVLDAQMRCIGKAEGLASGESVQSVHYVGDTAYLVTYRQSNPIFVIDLSDPQKPALLGQLKLSGLPEYLRPVGNGLLVGIGRSIGKNGLVAGVNLSLFDSSDPLQLKEIKKYQINGSDAYSEAFDHDRAVLHDESRGLLGFPVSTVDSRGRAVDSYYVFSYNRQNGFTLKANLRQDSGSGDSQFSSLNRGLIIGDVLYAFSPGNIASYNIGTFRQKGSIKLA